MDGNLPAKQDAGSSTERQKQGHQLTAQQQAAMKRAGQQANLIKEAAFASCMASALPISESIGASGYKVYRDHLLAEAGDPTDPIERMLIKQIALAHFRVGKLHAQAAETKCLEAARVYSSAAVRLTGELRRLALALRKYREPVSSKHFTVVRQQNVAAGQQQIAYVDQTTNQSEAPSRRLTDGQGTRRITHAPQTQEHLAAEPEAVGRRQGEPGEARPADPCGT